MHIILTGVSSFTGAWFAAGLAHDGHAVTGTLQRPADAYPELETRRIAMLRAAGVTLVENASYGNPAMLDLIGQGCDVLGFHGSDVRDYRSSGFDIPRAMQSNLSGIRESCQRAVAAGVGRLVYTGSIGEPGEGGGDAPERALSPYGLSKALTWQVIQHYAREAGLPVGKFVVPNPFGVLEQERFCTYLVRQWAQDKVPEVRTPDYVRDNIPVDKLARAYAGFATMPAGTPGHLRRAPSGYTGTQGAFTARFAREIGTRLDLPAPFTLARQTDFSEPLIRINDDAAAPGWNEEQFWDGLAADYAVRILGRPG